MDYLEKIKEMFKDNVDVFIKDNQQGLVLVYQEGLANINLFNRDYLPLFNKKDLHLRFPGVIVELEIKDSFEDEINEYLFTGDIIVYYLDKYYRFIVGNIPDRSISDSIAEPNNMIGARDGFNENIKVNTALIRTRLKTNKLKIEELYLGKRTRTKVRVLSIDGITNRKIKKSIIDYIKKIDIDSLLNLSDISQYLTEKSFVPTIRYTGAADVASMSLLNGQVIVLIDRLPVCIVAPISIFFLTLERSDYEVPLYYAMITRMLSIIGLFLAIFGCGILYSFSTFQSGNLSPQMISVLKATQRGVIFGTFAEITIILLIFEIYQSISHRSPGVTIQTIVIVLGGFLIGQNTVSAGIVGVVIISFTALCYLSGYIASGNVTLLSSISIMRFIILLSSLVLGLYGVVIASTILLGYLYRQKTFGVHFTHPFIPFEIGDIKRFFLVRSSSLYCERTAALKTEDKVIKNVSKM